MAAIERVDSMINDIEIEITKQNRKHNKLTFFDVEEINIDELNDNMIDYYFKSHYKPIVIRNGGSHFPAIKKWKTDFKYLIEKCGDNLIYIRSETDKNEYRKGQKYKIDKMKLSKYLNQILTKDPKSLSQYMAVCNIRYKLKELIDDVPLCNFELSQTHKGDHVRIFQLFENNKHKFKLHSGPHLWIAKKDHYEFCHFDPDDSILCMIDGIKKVRIFAPKFLNGMHCNIKGTKGRTIQSQIDFTETDIFNKYPNFAESNVYGYNVLLNPGDILFIPAFYFHQVTSLTNSISINYFCGDYDDENNHYPTRIFNHCYDSLKYWFLNIIHQNKNFEQFQSVIANLEKGIYNTFYKQWHDFLTDEQTNKLTNEVIKYLMDENVRKKDDLYYKYGDLNIKSNLPIIHRNNPYIKIRGLLHRED